MEYYDYKTRSRINKKVYHGIITADDLEGAADILKQRGEDIIEIYEMRDIFNIRKTIYSICTRPRKKVILEFLTMIKFMLESGMSLHEALVTIRDSGTDNRLKNMARTIADEVRKGAGLSTAMKKSGFFDEATVEQIGAGEESGNVNDAIGRLIKQIERDMSFRGKIKSAMIYPIIISIVMVVVLWVMMTVIVPTLSETLKSMGGELPLITRAVIGVSNTIKNATPFLITVIVIGVVVFKMLMKNSGFKYIIDTNKLRIPLVGTMLEKIEFSRFARNLSALQRSGITLVSSLNIVSSSIKNLHIRTKIEKASRLIELSGMNLSTALSKSGKFPSMMLQLIDVGINSGQVCEVLDRISIQYENEVDTMLKRVVALVEPALIIFVGLAAGSVVLSIFLPMMSLTSFI